MFTISFVISFVPFAAIALAAGALCQAPIKHNAAVVPAPPLCIWDDGNPNSCRASITAEVRRDPASGHEILTATTTNASQESIVVRESSPRLVLAISVLDVWGNPAPFTEREKKRQKGPFNLAGWHTYSNVLEPAQSSSIDEDLSEMYALTDDADYTVSVTRIIYRQAQGSPYQSMLEVIRSKPLIFRVPVLATPSK
jgi:hypothetical protein